MSRALGLCFFFNRFVNGPRGFSFRDVFSCFPQRFKEFWYFRWRRGNLAGYTRQSSFLVTAISGMSYNGRSSLNIHRKRLIERLSGLARSGHMTSSFKKPQTHVCYHSKLTITLYNSKNFFSVIGIGLFSLLLRCPVAPHIRRTILQCTVRTEMRGCETLSAR